MAHGDGAGPDVAEAFIDRQLFFGAYSQRLIELATRLKDGDVLCRERLGGLLRFAQLIYRMLRWGQDYVDIGEQEYEKRFERQRLPSLEESARQLDYKLIEDACPTG